ncbi:MAG: hypothetical protein KAT32_00810 [Candidatus Moranbacteria bacterium]|nr:hypothetical protein [Candidatus Moranbacteria bacterium]
MGSLLRIFNNEFDFTSLIDVYQEGENVVVKTPISDIVLIRRMLIF